LAEPVKTIVQCDFDGTVTIEDASFVLLDAFSGEEWRQLLTAYEKGSITVGRFNSESFGMVTADKETLLEVVRRDVRLRPGFVELVETCRRKGYRFVIISNGLRFYIDEILHNAGITGIEVHAAETSFQPDGLRVHYTGPDGTDLDDEFKLAFTNRFISEGYRVIYLGNGSSDVTPASRSSHVFATDSLLKYFRQLKMECTPFKDHFDVIREIETWG